MNYEYDVVKKNVLIRIGADRKPEILHRGDKCWCLLMPRPDNPDDLYCRAIFLGGGCWEDLEFIDDFEVQEILEEWGYDEMPPEAEDVNIPQANRDDIFNGELKKIQIISNNICYGPCPLAEEETEQHLTINSEGEVWLTRLSYGNGPIEKTSFNIDRKDAEFIFTLLRQKFSKKKDIYMVTDVGSWDMTITTDKGNVYQYSGPLIADDNSVVAGLSNVIRESTAREDLFVFDGNPDVITNLKVEYSRVTKVKQKDTSTDDTVDFSIWKYGETLTIDRETETIVNHIQFAEQCSVTNTYHVEMGVKDLLDDLWPEIFDDIEGNPDDIVDDPLNQSQYKITICTRQGQEKIIEGTFDKYGLPNEWPDFIEKVYDFISFYGIGEIFVKGIYDKPRRRSSDYIYCDVEFEPGGRTYCYIADEDSYEINDTVLVPAGKDNHEAIVRIVDKNYYSAENVPYPVDRVKHIIRLADEDDI